VNRLLQRIWKGELDLAETFWLYGVLALAALHFVGQFVLLQIALAGAEGIVALGLVFLTAVGGYQVLVSVGVWRSARRYDGARAARIATFDPLDPGRNIALASRTLKRDAAYPLGGIWKKSCGEDFGLVIEPASAAGMYAVTFCGPGGCFKPGAFRPDTPLVGDPAYRVLGPDKLAVGGRDGFTPNRRCE